MGILVGIEPEQHLPRIVRHGLSPLIAQAPERHPPRPARASTAGRARACSPPAARTGRSEEHTSELQSLMRISYAVFCLKKKNNKNSQLQQTSIRRKIISNK